MGKAQFRRASVLLSLTIGAAYAAPSLGQTAPIPHRDIAVNVDSGIVANHGAVPGVVFSTIIESRRASWLRLRFAEVTLAGAPATGDGSYLRITSLLDGGQQPLNAEHVGHWNNTSAYFNGDAVLLELVAYPGTGGNRVRLTEMWAGDPTAGFTDTICGPTDDRQLSTDPRTARLMPIGCTAWLINDGAHCFLTAGHCISASTTNAVVQFNVPLSNANGSTVNPPPQHQYPAHQPSIRSIGSGGVGNDAAYFGANPNSVTQLTAYQAQGAAFTIANAPAPTPGQQIRITGYGTVSSPVSPTWSQVQKTHVGPYAGLNGNNVRYTTDTTGGNSGSPVIDETTGNAIGIHTHGGCTSAAGTFNNGTAIQHPGLQNFLANPLGVCIPPVCYADCNGSGNLTVADFGCFQGRYVLGNMYADCDAGGSLTVADFGCFQGKYVVGCP
ncbi:MAG: trypsin-like serine peptidase [Phycisphaerales bacterium]